MDQLRSKSDFFKNFLGILIFLIMWVCYEFIFWRSGNAKVQRLQDIDLATGRRQMTRSELEKLMGYEGMGIWERKMGYLKF